jgi:hypothetical protein
LAKVIIFLFLLSVLGANPLVIGKSRNEVAQTLNSLEKREGIFIWKDSPFILLQVLEGKEGEKIYEWAKKGAFQAEDLFGILDSQDRGGRWYELHHSVDPELMKYFQPRVIQKWALWTNNGISAIAERFQQKSGYYIRIIDFEPDFLSAKKRPLVSYLKDDILKDFVYSGGEHCLSKGDDCRLSHRAIPLIEGRTSKNPRLFLRMDYSKQKPFLISEDCFQRSAEDRLELIEGLNMYLYYQYLQAINILIQPVAELFNWQIFEWIQFGASYKVSQNDLEPFLLHCQLPPKFRFITIPFDQGNVDLYTDFKGILELELRLK